MAGSPPKRSCHSAWPSTTTCVRPGSFSPVTNPRPSAGRTRSTSKKAALTAAPSRRTASPWPVSVIPVESSAENRSSVFDCFSMSRKFWGDSHAIDLPFQSASTWTRRSASGNGSGRSSTAFTTLKIALVAPIPSASVSAATSVKPGDCASRFAA
jgi:hypothetical protein